MSQYLPTGNFKWMTDKEISKIDLGKYKADGKKGLILEVDLEYPQELHDIHNDYPVAPEKVKVSNNMLSAYCKKIAEKYNISIGLVSKLIPTLRDKKEYVLHYRNLQLYLDLSLNEFPDNMIRSGHRRLARSFNLCYRYIDDLIVFNNKKFLDYLKEIYPSQLTVEKANKSDHLADYLDLTFIIDSGGKLSTRLYDKRDDFDFYIVNFPFLSSNIPSGPFYGVYISQLIRYA